MPLGVALKVDEEVSFPESAPDCSVICLVDPSTNQVNGYVFDVRTQKWRSISNLTLTSEAPLFGARSYAGVAELLISAHRANGIPRNKPSTCRPERRGEWPH
jgi:hypothetical protein